MALIARIVLLALGCFLAFPSLARAASSYDEELVRFMSYGEGYAHALAGTGKRSTSRKQPNIHAAGQNDEIVTEQLPGVEISWLHPPSDRKVRMLYSLSITSRAAHLPLLKIGVSTEADIIKYVGSPVKKAGTALTYHAPAQAGADVLVFHLRGGKLARVYWEWFID
jgi:hypothetical protein